jgi:hypothetical protein
LIDGGNQLRKLGFCKLLMGRYLSQNFLVQNGLTSQ